MIDIYKHQGCRRPRELVVEDRDQAILERTAIGEPRQGIRIGDTLVLVQLLADLIHFLAALGDVLNHLFALCHRIAGGRGQDVYGAAQQIGAVVVPGADALASLAEKPVVAIECQLFLPQRTQNGIQFDRQAGMGIVENAACMAWKVFSADIVQFFLRGVAAEGRQFTSQRGIGADIGFIEKFVIPRNRCDPHGSHGVGNLPCHVGNLRLGRNRRTHR
ncbi:hypothetical protein RHSP_51601 [Rhizobium freirei PRF 81]|uniref:Uncharacterized protein n=1 Tax=Rhizobium freirei PRF 81 TaxID=363754 RepID=N6UGF2_9HYPH|nr:hypothetical protein RHSP_51601 [Rhizobium freirei PRF 81]